MARNRMLARVVNTGVDGTSLSFDVEVTVLEPSGLGASADLDDEWLLPNPVVVSANATRDDVHDAIAANVVAQLDDPLLKEEDVVVIGYGGKGRKGERGRQGRDGRPGGKGNQGAKYRNAWVAGNAYATDDVVGFDGGSWIALADIIAGSAESFVEPDEGPSLWGVLAKNPPKWRGEWKSSVDRYRPGDVVWVNTTLPNHKDKQTQYICVAKHVPTSSNKPTTSDVNSPSSKWEIFLDTADPPDDGTDGASFVWRNAWSSGSGYAPNDVVTWDSATYICIQTIVPFTSAAITEPDDPASASCWKVMTDHVPRNANPFAWQSGKLYRKAQLVKSERRIWLCMQRHTSGGDNKPGSSEAHWTEYSADGTDGITYVDRGTWSQTVASPLTYNVNDLVKWEDATFLCIHQHVHSGSSDPEPDDLFMTVSGVSRQVWKEWIGRPLKPKGNWNKDTNYRKGDLVRYTAGTQPTQSYACTERVKGVNNTAPPNAPSKWSLVTSDGPQGTLGPQGVAGSQGSQGGRGAQGAQGWAGARGRSGAGAIEICDGDSDGGAIALNQAPFNGQPGAVDEPFDVGTMQGYYVLWVKMKQGGNNTVLVARHSSGGDLATVTIGSSTNRKNGWYRGDINYGNAGEIAAGTIQLHCTTNNGGQVKKAKLVVLPT